MLAIYTEEKRAIERLNGIMMGISVDNKITNDEIIHLSQ